MTIHMYSGGSWNLFVVVLLNVTSQKFGVFYYKFGKAFLVG